MKALISYFRKNQSLLSIVLICLTITEVHLNLMRHKQRQVITWDVAGYYSYLPAAFIEHDLKLSFINAENQQDYYGVKYAYLDDAAGNHVFKYSMGMAVLYAPFFFTAHLLAEPLGYTDDGYSEIYHLLIEYSGLFYLLFGLLFLRRLLRMYYSESITAICLFTIFFGTNLLCYTTIDPAMSHAYTFSLFAALLYYVVAYYQSPKWSHIFILGVLSGLIVLIRPLNVFFLLAIVLVGVTNIATLKQRLNFIKTHYQHALLFVLITGLTVSPQLLYWHTVTGHFLVFSYGAEGFFFGNPHILECLLGFRKGWLIYSPVFFFSLAGLYAMRTQRSKDFLSLHLILLPLYIYVIASWWCWWYGGSFSLRPMIDLYPLLTVSLAACIFRIQSLTKTPRYIFSVMLVCMIALNIYQTFQYKYNIIHYDAMTARSYMNTLGKMSRSETDTSLLDHPDYDRALKGLGD